MTNAPWILRGRAVTAACLSLTLAAPVPAAIAATPSGAALANVLERDAHRSKALEPARRELARKRAERAREQAGAKPTVKPPADRKDKAPADAAATRAAAETAARAKAAAERPAPAAPAQAAPATPAAAAPVRPESKPEPEAKPEPKSKAEPEAKAEPPKAADDKYGEDTALSLPTGAQAGPEKAATGGGSGTIGRLLISLLVVVGLIYGLTYALRRLRGGALGMPGAKGGAGGGLKAVASIPLGPGRSIHLVRAGQEYLLVGAAEHGVVPLRTYTEDEAVAAGLLDLDATKRTSVPTPAGVQAATTAQAEAPKAAVRSWDGLNLTTLVDDLRAKTVRR